MGCRPGDRSSRDLCGLRPAVLPPVGHDRVHVPNTPPESYGSMYDPDEIDPWADTMDDLIDEPLVQRQQRVTWGSEEFERVRDLPPVARRHLDPDRLNTATTFAIRFLLAAEWFRQGHNRMFLTPRVVAGQRSSACSGLKRRRGRSGAQSTQVDKRTAAKGQSQTEPNARCVGSARIAPDLQAPSGTLHGVGPLAR